MLFLEITTEENELIHTEERYINVFYAIKPDFVVFRCRNVLEKQERNALDILWNNKYNKVTYQGTIWTIRSPNPHYEKKNMADEKVPKNKGRIVLSCYGLLRFVMNYNRVKSSEMPSIP